MFRRLLSVLRIGLLLAGCALVLTLALCFTRVPWKLYRWFSTDAYVLADVPEVIVVLGGGGIPSESGLVRTYHAAVAANVHTNALVVVSLPADGELATSAVGKMREELVLHGVGEDRILIEDEGLNTRAQALGVRALLGEGAGARRLLLVTSPDHMRRAVLTFRKAGFVEVSGSAAYPSAVKLDVRYDSASLGGRSQFVPDVGRSLTLRYVFWSNLNYVSSVVRESFALGYYKLRGWV